jgi:hypothetical protein
MKSDHNRLRPRVCFLTEVFSPPTPGGQALFAAQLAKGLTEVGLGVLVVTRQTEPPSAADERVGNGGYVVFLRPVISRQRVGQRSFPC